MPAFLGSSIRGLRIVRDGIFMLTHSMPPLTRSVAPAFSPQSFALRGPLSQAWYRFIPLSEAYDMGLVSDEEIEKIAYYSMRQGQRGGLMNLMNVR